MFEICSAANIFRTRTLSSTESGGQFPTPWRGVPLLNRRGWLLEPAGRGGAFQEESREKKAVLSIFLSKYFAYVYYNLQVIIFLGPHYLILPPPLLLSGSEYEGRDDTQTIFKHEKLSTPVSARQDNKHFCILSHETCQISHLEL